MMSFSCVSLGLSISQRQNFLIIHYRSAGLSCLINYRMANSLTIFHEQPLVLLLSYAAVFCFANVSLHFYNFLASVLSPQTVKMWNWTMFLHGYSSVV